MLHTKVKCFWDMGHVIHVPTDIYIYIYFRGHLGWFWGTITWTWTKNTQIWGMSMPSAQGILENSRSKKGTNLAFLRDKKTLYNNDDGDIFLVSSKTPTHILVMKPYLNYPYGIAVYLHHISSIIPAWKSSINAVYSSTRDVRNELLIVL